MNPGYITTRIAFARRPILRLKIVIIIETVSLCGYMSAVSSSSTAVRSTSILPQLLDAVTGGVLL